MAEIDSTASAALALEGIVNELVRNINTLRKKAGLGTSDRVVCHVEPANGFVAMACETGREVILKECLLTDLSVGDVTHTGATSLQINNTELLLSASKTDTVVTLMSDDILFGEHDGGAVYKNYWEALSARSAE